MVPLTHPHHKVHAVKLKAVGLAHGLCDGRGEEEANLDIWLMQMISDGSRGSVRRLGLLVVNIKHPPTMGMYTMLQSWVGRCA